MEWLYIALMKLINRVGSYPAAFIAPWAIYLGFVIATLAIENSPLRGQNYFNWICRGSAPIYFFVGVALLWVVSRVWIGLHLNWSPWQRIVGLTGIGILEAAIVLVVFLFWAIGMIGGPINQG